MPSQINFFTTPNDISTILGMVEAKTPIQYTQMGRFASPQIDPAYSWRNLPDLGLAKGEQTALCTSYLATEQSRDLKFRESSGDHPHILDQLYNSRSVVLTPGGMWKQILIRDSIGTVWSDEYSAALMRQFHSAFRKYGTKIKTFMVGLEAEELLRSGTRLTIAEQSPAEFDLTI